MIESSARTQALLKLRAEQVARGPFNVAPYFAARAKGAEIWDVDGNRLIDFAGGIGVMNVGHSHSAICEVVQKQAEAFTHTCFNIVMYESYVALAQKLNQLVPGNFAKKTFLANSGAEAVENAIKIARHYTKRQAVIGFEHAFHGRTYLAMTLTSKMKPYKKGFGPFVPEVYRAPYPYSYRRPEIENYSEKDFLAELESFFASYISAEEVAAIILEPVLGEGGFIIPPVNFFKALRTACDKYGILLIADEVQTGFGRTGKFFAMEHFGVVADLTVMAKSLAAGLPLSAVTGKAEIMDDPMVGGLGGTYCGNPLACTAALKVIEIIESEKLNARAEAIGKIVLNRFQAWQKKWSCVGDARGLGAMCAIELVKDQKSKEPNGDLVKKIIQWSYQRGLILVGAGTSGNIIRTLMPLVISDLVLNEGLDILEKALEANQ
ncbi:MAG: 4-aminobutyrate--2-oxoglutarate transaminase [Verrucomicrobiae bacterium]|nr:4-aminobutyrate--2-oxoglutarate transaminase [Verrucomicrobiae bacterium]